MPTDLSSIRNLGIIAHIDAGKTSTTEGLLYFSGLTHRYGNIDDGTTVMDKTLIAAARKAALETHFNMSAEAPAMQQGTITYYFNLK